MAGEPARTLTRRGCTTRRRLLDAARDELVEAGGRLEIAALARRLNSSPALLYRYFGSKDGLVAAVVDEFYDEYEAAVFLTVSRDSTWQVRERERIAREVAFLYSHPLARAVIARRLQEPAAAHADSRRLATQIDVAARNVTRGQREGSVDPHIDAGLAAAAYLGAFRELVAAALGRPTPPPQPEIVEMMSAIGTTIVPSPQGEQ